MQQACFRPGRSSYKLIKVLTTVIEASFQRKLITIAIYIDLTSAYGTVWREGLLLKFSKIVPSSKLNKLLNTFLVNKNCWVHIVDLHSSRRNLNHGLPRGYILEPILFNLYTFDKLLYRRFQYANDTKLAVQNTYFRICGPY